MSRYRTQGSLIGSYRTPSSTTASGVYDITGATTYTSANLWAGTTPISTVVTVLNPMASGNGIYIPSGGTVTTVGNYQIITFTGSGSFTVNQTGTVELLMIGGGGSPTSAGSSAGGQNSTPGASSGGLIYYGSTPWEYRSGTAITLTSGTTYTVTIGGGAASQSYTSSNLRISSGGNTTITGGSINLIAYGGQGTGIIFSSDPIVDPNGYSTGAPGAGGVYWSPYAELSGGGSPYVISRNTTYAAPSQGYPGGAGFYNAGTQWTGPGGGGCGSPGGSQSPVSSSLYSKFGFGGNGFCTDISGTTAWYGGGGGGGGKYYGAGGLVQNPWYGIGGRGGGGDGGNANGTNGASGSPNTGAGGGGGGLNYYSGGGGGTSYYGTSGAGGSGVLIIKVPLYSTISVGNIANISTTGATVTTNGDYKTATFTGSGSFTVVSSQTNAVVEYLVIAGGGGGGYNAGLQGGGGGGGGFLEWTWGTTTGADFVGPKLTVNNGETYTVTVGGGGAGGTINYNNATQIAQLGGNTSIICTSYANNAFYVQALGGGAGGYGGGDNSLTPSKYNGGQGGSGGGIGNGAAGQALNTGGAPVLSPRQGYGAYVIALALTPQQSSYYGGGAGGPPPNSYSAGPGRASVITGSTYSAGGYSGSAGANSGNGGSGFTTTSGGSGIAAIRWKFQ